MTYNYRIIYHPDHAGDKWWANGGEQVVYAEGWGGEIKPSGDPIRPRKYEI
jgi:hypothetical protein